MASSASSPTRIAAGIDGLIVVDLPPEMDEELCMPALKAGHQLHPPGDADHRRQAPAQGAAEHLRLRLLRVDDRHHRLGAGRHRARCAAAVKRIKGHTGLPVCVGFGVKTAEQAQAIGASADGVVVGTAIVNAVANVLGPNGKTTADPAEAVATLVSGLAQGVRAARLAAAE